MKRLVLSLFLLSALSSVGTLLHSQQVSAVSAADWKPGRIIDDVVFQNKNAMTVAQIQQFIESKVPVCDTWGTLPMWSGGPTRAQWSADNGKDLAPYTCLRDYRENPSTKVNNASDPRVVVPGGLSAAQLIYNASQAQNVNPQVFLTLLQKEQSLVTDDWPYAKQFERATGNNCPDTAPCNPTFAWLWTQVNNAGAQFNNYVANFDNYNYAPGWNNILYHPNSACGTRSIFIENAYTAALYIYTPYTPNQAALDNMYSTGDGCSSYGNRNFWRLFNDWFGSSTVAGYDYVFHSANIGSTNIEPDQTFTATVRLTNMGSKTWYSDGNTPENTRPVRLSNKGYSQNPFADTTDPAWLNTRTQVRMVETSVAPGATATFTFRMKGDVQNIGKSWTSGLIPVVDGFSLMRDIGMGYRVTGILPPYDVLQQPPTNITMLAGDTVRMTIRLKNTGTTTWYSDGNTPTGIKPLRLATVGYQATPFADTTDPAWLNTRTQVRMVETSVAPGATATFTFRIRGSYSTLSQTLMFNPVVDGRYFLSSKLSSTNLSVPSPQLSYSFVSATNPPAFMTPGQVALVKVTLKNTGNTIWRNVASNGNAPGSIRLGMIRPYYSPSAFFSIDDDAWLSPSQVSMKTPYVLPGANGEFEFEFKAPTQPGKYASYFTPVVDGVSWMPDIGMGFGSTVAP